MKRICTVMCLCMAMVAVPEQVWASGSYSGRPPKPPEHIDAATYELGKNLFNGKVNPTGNGVDKAEQAKHLGSQQAKLPKRVQAMVNLPALAGKLSPSERQALDYFVSVRYKVK